MYLHRKYGLKDKELSNHEDLHVSILFRDKEKIEKLISYYNFRTQNTNDRIYIAKTERYKLMLMKKFVKDFNYIYDKSLEFEVESDKNATKIFREKNNT